MEFICAEEKQWKEIKTIYMEAFPKRERKPYFALRHSVKTKKAVVMAATEGEQVLGFIVLIPYKDNYSPQLPIILSSVKLSPCWGSVPPLPDIVTTSSLLNSIISIIGVSYFSFTSIPPHLLFYISFSLLLNIHPAPVSLLPLTMKERMFCVIAYMPKATVQAAIGGVPLAMGLSCGNIVLTVAVTAILITAPLGAFLIEATYKKWLGRQTEILSR